MYVERTKPRISPKEFRDFTVELRWQNGAFYKGHLGNISEEGLCFIQPSDSEIPGRDQEVYGTISGRNMEDDIEFSGNILWSSPNQLQGNSVVFSGIQFEQKIDLPDSILAISMALFD